MKNKIDKKIIIAVIALLLFVVITITLLEGKILTLDKNIHDTVINIRTDNLTKVMKVLTNICSIYSLVGISLLTLIIIKNKKIPLIIISNLISVTVLSQLFKYIIRRERPIGINLITETGYSYPSGHSMVSMAFFGLIAYLIYKNSKNKIYKIISIFTIAIMILLIGFSRIYLGVHYFSDVLGGFVGAISYLLIFITIMNKFKEKKWI